MYFERSERYIADHQRIAVVRDALLLETFDADMRFGIKRTEDVAGQIVEFDSRQIRFRPYRKRHQAEKMSDAGRWFEDAATVESEAFHHIPYRRYDFEWSIKCGGRGCASRFVFIGCQ